MPGYRWDGVDRGNGYERKYFDSINSKRDKEQIGHYISSLDLWYFVYSIYYCKMYKYPLILLNIIIILVNNSDYLKYNLMLY